MQLNSPDDRDSRERFRWKPVAAASASSLVGIGLARFAYTPLLPALISAHWFASAAAAYLGAANLAGYLVGALTGRVMARHWPVVSVLRTMMVLATLTFLASAVPVNFEWFFVWRLASGISGGALMVLAAPLVLASVPPGRRGLASGAIFMSVGLGVVASGSVIPLLLRYGLGTTWLGLGAISGLLTVAVWSFWPREAEIVSGRAVAAQGEPTGAAPGRTMIGLYLAYGANAVGLVPHMLFLVDFVERALKLGVWAGSSVWVTFGIGAMVGPLLLGHVGDRIGFQPAVRLGLLVQAVAVVSVALVPGTIAVFVSSFVVGAFVPGIVPLMLGRLHEMIDDVGLRQRAWSFATVAFAVGQAAGAYALSFLLARTEDYALLFTAGAGVLMVALAIDMVANLRGIDAQPVSVS